jgi:hypothetical protein
MVRYFLLFALTQHQHDDYSILSTLSEFHVTKKVSPWRTDLVSYSTLLDDENERAVANMAALDTIMNYDASFHSII